MIESFLVYGQWVILILSILSLYLVSSVNHETRLNGYILTGVSRFSGALIFIFVDLFAFVIDLGFFFSFGFRVIPFVGFDSVVGPGQSPLS